MEAKLTSRLVKSLTPESKPYEVTDPELRGFRLRVQPSGVMTYYYSYRTREGKRSRYCIGKAGSLTPVQARDIAEQLSAKVASGVDVQAQKKQVREDAEKAKLRTLGGFIEHEYGPWVKSERRTGSATLKRIQSNFAYLFDKPLEDISEWDIAKWRSSQRKNGKATTTMNRDVVALKAALSMAVKWKIISDNPLAEVKPEKTDRHGTIRHLSNDEEARLRSALDEREADLREGRISGNEWRRQRGYEPLHSLDGRTFVDHIKPMVLLSLNTGMRRGEVFSLTWEAMNLEAAMLTVHGKTAKSVQTRHIPLNDETFSIMRAWQGQTGQTMGLVFPSINGKRLDNVRRSWATVLKLAGVQNFRWHDLRHTFASNLVMAGVDLNTVRELMGHGDIKMTLRYAHLAPEHKAAAVAKLTAPGKWAVSIKREAEI